MSPVRASSSEGQRPASSPPDIAQRQHRQQQPTSPRRRAGAATKRFACAVSTTFRKLGHRLHHRHNKASAVGGSGAASSSYTSAAPGTGNSLQYSGRLSMSHPDVSSSDIAGLARDSVASTPCQRAVPGREQASYSDTTLLRSRRRLQQQGVLVDEDTSLDVTATAPALMQTAPPATPPALLASGLLAATEGGEEVFPLQDPQVSVCEFVLALVPSHLERTEPSSGVVLYKLDVHLRCGKNLVAKDACGTSDPYVKFKQGGRQVYRSRTVSRSLDPYWDECFTVAVRDLWDPLVVRVFDYDFGLQDDFMGAATVELHTLEIDRPTDILLNLTESGKAEDANAKDLGYIVLTVTLLPASARDDVEQQPPAAAPTLGTPASELHPAMALNAATDQQYHLLDQDGTADDQMDQLQGDHDTPKQPQVQAGYSDKLQQGTSNDPPRTKNLRWFSSEEEENAYKSADDKHSSRSHSRSPGRKPHSPSKKSAPAPTQQNLHRGPPGGGSQRQRRGSRMHPTGIITSGKLGGSRGSQVCMYSPPITQNVHYQAVITENKQLKQRLDKYENKIMWLEKQLAQLMGATPKTTVQASQNLTSHPSEKLRDNGHIQPQSTPPRDPVANIRTEQTATNLTLQQQLQLMQQHILQQTEAQMKQFFVEFQDLKRYVHESLDKETKRRRKQSQPRSQESDAKSMLTSDAESTPTSSHHGN
ncbi:hypothetical protein MRX96_036965 [Rhipicephalus microplus]